MSELVALIDRFIDGELAYSLEWDDFISWTHGNSNIDAARRRIAEAEPLFFSKDDAERARALELLLTERNRAAALSGLQQRANA